MVEASPEQFSWQSQLWHQRLQQHVRAGQPVLPYLSARVHWTNQDGKGTLDKSRYALFGMPVRGPAMLLPLLLSPVLSGFSLGADESDEGETGSTFVTHSLTYTHPPHPLHSPE